jgi:sugar phosphate isomerase/epimerase|tara:strand:- start:2685 stop:3653 length:969 start_codon:yes stop_codon:yes gene_type:complete
MQIGLFTDGLAAMGFTEALDWAVSREIEAVEIGTGGFSNTPHCNLQELVESGQARDEFMGAITSRNLTLSALNCNGNPLDPDPERGARTQQELRQTIELAGQLGLDTVVTMSGCPGTPEGGGYPNWVTHPWQQEFADLLEWQWAERVTPYWRELGALAADVGVKIAIEAHPGQVVYNTYTLVRLREIVGPHLGANLDPSHFFYQGIDAPMAIQHLGVDAVFHVHAKDACLNPHETAVSGTLDTRAMANIRERSWAYRTLGFGHDELWWRKFVTALSHVGYNGSLSIEHEDPVMSTEEGIEKSVNFLKPILLRTQPEESPPWM